MDAHWVWWFMAVVLVIAEMFSDTFYLLAVTVGLAAAGLVAYLGVGWVGQGAVECYCRIDQSSRQRDTK